MIYAFSETINRVASHNNLVKFLEEKESIQAKKISIENDKNRLKDFSRRFNVQIETLKIC